MTRYFLDTEFQDNADLAPITLLSIAIISEEDDRLYAEIKGAPSLVTDPWIKDNVLPHLRGGSALATKDQLRTEILRFVGPNPEFWGYYCDYDWVVLCQLIGRMSDHPGDWPYYCRDLRQALDERGFSHICQPNDAIHNAEDDAMWVADTWAGYIDPLRG